MTRVCAEPRSSEPMASFAAMPELLLMLTLRSRPRLFVGMILILSKTCWLPAKYRAAL